MGEQNWSLGVSGCWALRVLGPVPSAWVCGTMPWALWWAELCPGVALESEGLKATCSLMGGAAFPPSCLIWAAPVLVSTGWWAEAELGPDTSNLEGGFPHGTCQLQGPYGRSSSPKWPTPVPVSPRWAPGDPCFLRDSPRSAGGPDSGSCQITASVLFPELY